jgi:phenylpyruvate tautomerase PptA (4-oxalocrotonate tautomerase family)
MPIVDVQVVGSDEVASPNLAAELAAALGQLFATRPGSVWVRLSVLPSNLYAENGVPQAQRPNPVFVRVMHADLPPLDGLAAQARALATVIGGCLKRPPDLVHIEYAPPGRGRVAFGGTLLQ